MTNDDTPPREEMAAEAGQGPASDRRLLLARLAAAMAVTAPVTVALLVSNRASATSEPPADP